MKMIKVFGWLLMSLLTSEKAIAQLFDQGMNNPSVRTDYASPYVGVWSPLAWDPMCLDNNRRLGTTLITACVTNNSLEGDLSTFYHPGQFNVSNFFSCGAWDLGANCVSSQSGPRFWTLLMNNEPWWIQLNAPPNQSLPRAVPGSGIMGFAMYRDTPVGENFYRAHLVNNNTFPNPHPLGNGAIPFLAIAIDSEGNGGNVGTVRRGLSRNLQFTSRVWDAGSIDQTHAYNHFFYAFSEWEGKKRGVFVNLYWGTISWGGGGTRNWNWQAKESSQRNGGNLAFFNLGEVPLNKCPGVSTLQPITQLGVDRTYNIDLSAIFECASGLGLFDSPMPPNMDLPIHEIGFATETSLLNYIWASVHGVYFPANRHGEESAAPGAINSPFTNTVRARITNTCRGRCENASDQRQSRLGMPFKMLRDRVRQSEN